MENTAYKFSIETSSSKPVLVTGGCGFIGSYITKYLLNNGFQVKVLDNLSSGAPISIPMNHPRLELYKGSVLDQAMVEKAGRDCGLIFHLANIVGVKKVKLIPKHTFTTSFDGTKNILDIFPQIPTVVFSSSSVYGLHSVQTNESHNISENNALSYDGNIKGYAVGKYYMEKLALEHSKKGNPVLIVRPFNVVGQGQIGEHGMVIPRFLQFALNNEPLPVYGDGSQTRCFSHVDKFIEVLFKLLHFSCVWQHGGNIINIGSSQQTSIKELAQLIIEKCDSKSTIEYIPFEKVFPNQKDVTKRVPDNEYISSLIGDYSWDSIDEIITKIITARVSNKIIME